MSQTRGGQGGADIPGMAPSVFLGGGAQIAGSFGTSGRGPRLLSGGGRKATVISTVSTLVVLAALGVVFWLAPGSAAFRHAFFSPRDMWQAFIGDPKKGYYSVGAAIWLNIRMFLIAEVLILIKAYDDTFSQTVLGMNSYRHDEIEWGSRFAPAFSVDRRGDLVLELKRLSETVT